MDSVKRAQFVIFDVETTGLSPASGDRVIEIAALKLHNLKEVSRFHSLIDPQRPVSPGAFNVNRISADMLDGAPLARDIFPEFLRFVGQSCLVGHNINFDLGFLINELSLIGHELDENTATLDTLRLARELLPDLPSYSLRAVAYSLGNTEIQRHRAMSDVEMTCEVFIKLLEIADRRDICEMEHILNI